MTLLRTTPYTWPYSLYQLRLDEPSRSFSNNPSDAELSEFNVYRIQQTERPSYDPYAERIEETAPTENEGLWYQTWAVIPLTAEEAEAYYRAQNPPDYQAFWLGLPQSVNTLLHQASPMVEHGLSGGLILAQQDQLETFVIAWGQAKGEGLVSQELTEEIKTLAEENNFPQEVIDAL